MIGRSPAREQPENGYDAIVVGARCAGSPTAMLLAREGYKFPPPELEPVLAAVQSSQESMDEFAQVAGAVTSPAEFLSEQNVARLLAAAGEPSVARRSRT